jgi:hypothetical protein
VVGEGKKTVVRVQELWDLLQALLWSDPKTEHNWRKKKTLESEVPPLGRFLRLGLRCLRLKLLLRLRLGHRCVEDDFQSPEAPAIKDSAGSGLHTPHRLRSGVTLV